MTRDAHLVPNLIELFHGVLPNHIKLGVGVLGELGQLQGMSAQRGSARRGKGCLNGVKSKHLLLILWVFGMLLLLVCRITVAEFVSAPLVAWSWERYPRSHAAVLHDKTKLPLACCAFTQVHFNPCHFPGEWDPASFWFLSIEPSSAL